MTTSRQIPRRVLGAALLATLLCTACGSTVQATDRPGSPDSLNDGFTATGATPTSGPADTSGQRGLVPGQAVPGRATSAPAAPATVVPDVSRPVGPSGSLAPVTLGFQWLDTSSGTGGIDPSGKVKLGDPTQQAKATVDWLNAHGGIAGHKVRLVTHAIDYLRLFNNSSAEYQAACTAFTEDAKVSIAALYTNDPDLVTCLSRRGVTSVSNVYVVPESVYRLRYFSPSSVSYERGHSRMIAGLAGRGYFKGAKVGLLYNSGAMFKPVLSAVKQALAAQGITVASEFGSSISNAAQGANDASAAVLRFRSAGVSHVAFVDFSGNLTGLFMNAAQSQAYYPKYALSTANNLLGLQLLGQQDQLANAVALGWTPGEAGSERARIRSGWNSTGKLCGSILREAGVDMSDDTTAQTAILVCDTILAAAAAGKRSGNVSADEFLRGAEALGVTFQSAVAFSTRLSPGRRDGASGSRFLRWGRDCTCWVADGTGPAL